MTLTVVNGPVIQRGEALSDGVDCSGGNAVRITMPSDWTGANLTFLISTDGAFYNDLFDSAGAEVTMVVVPGSAVHISAEWASFWNFIKFRSGTRGHPVVQAELRQFAITLNTPTDQSAAPLARQGGDQRR